MRSAAGRVRKRTSEPGNRLWGYARRMSDSPNNAFHEETTDPLVADVRNF